MSATIVVLVWSGAVLICLAIAAWRQGKTHDFTTHAEKTQQPAPALPPQPMAVIVPGHPDEDRPCDHDEVVVERSLCEADERQTCLACGKDVT